MKVFYVLVCYVFFSVCNSTAQEYAQKCFNEGLIALKINQCRKADSLFKKSAQLQPNKDIYYNIALARNCLNDHEGFCYYMTLAKDMGDSVAHFTVKKYCKEFDKKSYLEAENLLRKDESKSTEKEVFVISEEQPKYPGGEKAMLEYLMKNISYPPNARDAGIQGIVYITFIIEEDGNITNVNVLRGIGGGCDEEALRVVKAMPKWKPGMQRGKPVRVLFNLPIKFKLDGVFEEKPTPYTQGIQALVKGECIVAEDFFSNNLITKKKTDIEASDYYYLALAKICLKDSGSYCYNLKLAQDLNHEEAKKLYRYDCQNFNLESFLENEKIMKTIEKQQNNSKLCDEVHKVADVQPMFPGDIPAMNEYINSNLIYPKEALKNNVCGKVYLSFIITQEGKIENIKVLKGIGSGCDEEAIRIIKNMPEWVPGKTGGSNVCVQYSYAIKFSPEKK